jgi:hypothetical protein
MMEHVLTLGRNILDQKMNEYQLSVQDYLQFINSIPDGIMKKRIVEIFKQT